MRPSRVVLLLSALAAPALGQRPAPETGRLVEGLQCEADPTQTYTLYLPGAYRPERTWPTLVVLDPRGRSVLAAELFREAAEEYGWILLSSNDSRSDTPSGNPNVRALRALWPEALGRYAGDPKRVYLAGFSGTAKFAWAVGRQSQGVAGVVASGAGWEPEHFDQKVTFPCFGAAGTIDFNNTPMREVHGRLAEWGTPNRLEIFDGAHEWMPPALAREAVEWMEVQAMRTGLRSRDAALVERLFEADVARAEALEQEGRLLDAQRRYAAVAETYEGLMSVAGPRREAARIGALPATRLLAREERRWDEYEESVWRRHREAYAALAAAVPPFFPARLQARFRVDELKEHARAEGYEGVVGRRLLQTVGTNAGFYVAGDLMRRGDPARAAVALAVATEALPERGGFWYNLACARARAGARGSALDALEEAARRGFDNPDLLSSDEDLASLHDEERFTALLRRLDDGRSTPR